jgi:hypothetical protein
MPFPRGAGDKVAAAKGGAPASSLCGLCSHEVAKDEQYIEGELFNFQWGGQQPRNALGRAGGLTPAPPNLCPLPALQALAAPAAPAPSISNVWQIIQNEWPDN